jgi:hypothetical protein
MSISPKQRDVLDQLTIAGALTLDELKARLGAGHGVTQALVALVRRRMVAVTDDGKYRRTL